MSEAILRDYRQQIDTLTETIRQMQAAQAVPVVRFPNEWRLGPSCSAILNALLRTPGSVVTYDRLEAEIDDTGVRRTNMDAGRQTLQVQVCRLRKHLKAHGVEVETYYGQGYLLPIASAKIIRAAAKEALRIVDSEGFE